MRQADAVVVGAGFAGLRAATRLREAGLTVRILEARDRVGGRVEADATADGARIDTGGQFFCEDMPEVTGLARAFGKTFIEPYAKGRPIGRPPLPSGVSPTAVWNEVGALRERMRRLNPGTPALRSVAVAEWIRAQVKSPEAEAAFLGLVSGLWCIDPAALPLPFLVSNDRRVTNEVSELQYFLRESMTSLAEDLAAPFNDALHLNSAVEAVSREGDYLVVRTASETMPCRAVVIAVPPVRAREIHFEPAIPPRLDRALRAWVSGAAAKIVLRYARPFWRDNGLSGTVTWRDPPGLYACEASIDDAYPTLVFFVAGPTLLRWRAEGEGTLKACALTHLTDALGDEAGRPLQVTIRDWTDDRWSGGAYADLIVDTAALNAEQVIREGCGSLQFASSELASSFPGYVEGAIVAGHEAADRTLAALKLAPRAA